MISDMYNQVIGPDENSKKAIKTRTNVTDGVVKGLDSSPVPVQSAYFRLKNPTKKRTIAIPKLKTSIICLLPYLKSNTNPPNVAKKLTTPTKNVIMSGEMPPKLLNMVLE